LRNLERKFITPKPSRKRNIIKDYTEFDSKIYASAVWMGTSIDNLNSAPPFQMDIHRDFEGITKDLSHIFVCKLIIQNETQDLKSSRIPRHSSEERFILIRMLLEIG
jgi:hypothetical protein